jgi:hypothetical protein
VGVPAQVVVTEALKSTEMPALPVAGAVAVQVTVHTPVAVAEAHPDGADSQPPVASTAETL